MQTNLNNLRRELKAQFPPGQTAAMLNAFAVSPLVTLAADSATVVNSTLVNANELALTLDLGFVYHIEGMLRINTTATPGFQIDFNGGNVGIAAGGYFNASVIYQGGASPPTVSGTTLATALSAGAVAVTHAIVNAIIRPTSGNALILRYAQAVTNATPSGLQAGSFLKATIVTPATQRIK